MYKQTYYTKLLNNKPAAILQAFIAGAILPLAFAPHNYWPLAFLGIALLLHKWLHANTRSAFVLGWVFGLGFFGIGISWVFVSIHDYGYTDVPLAAFITAMFIAFLSIIPAIHGAFISYFYKSHSKIRLLIVIPFSWVLFEWLRSWLFTGFPWLYLGYTQLNTQLAGFAPIIGVYGISFLVILSTSLLIFILQKTTIMQKIIALILLGSIWYFGYRLQFINWTTPENTTLKASLVQGNIEPDNKFLLNNPISVVTDLYLEPSIKLKDSNIIIWPENSLPLPLQESSAFIEKIDQMAKDKNSTLILGLPVKVNNKYYNSLIAIGNANGTYHKQHLVPFGDYLPFDLYLRGFINFFDIPMSSFIAGSKNQPALKTPYGKISPFICYEISFPEEVRKSILNANSQVILTISEDGWFGNSWGPHQHLQIARMRALENGRYVLRSTTSGISAIIDEKGSISKQSPQFKPYVLTGEFTNFTGFTPWTTYGQWPLILVCGLILFLLVFI